MATPFFDSGDNAAAVVAIAAIDKMRHLVTGIAWSYDDTPTGGRLVVESPAGTVKLDVDITTSGPGFIPFTIDGKNGQAVVVTLAAGGSGVIGKLNVLQA